MEQKQTKRLGKVAIYFNNPTNEKSPRYKLKAVMETGEVYEIPLWFNGSVATEGFNVNGVIEKVLNPAPPREKPVSQDEAKEGWQKVKEAAGLNEGEAPKEEDDVPF